MSVDSCQCPSIPSNALLFSVDFHWCPSVSVLVLSMSVNDRRCLSMLPMPSMLPILSMLLLSVDVRWYLWVSVAVCLWLPLPDLSVAVWHCLSWYVCMFLLSFLSVCCLSCTRWLPRGVTALWVKSGETHPYILTSRTHLFYELENEIFEELIIQSTSWVGWL